MSPRIDQALALGRKAWPALEVSAADLAAFAREQAATMADCSDEVLEDIFLACACARNIQGSLRCFRERFHSVVVQAVRSFDESSSFAEEVYQRLSEALFVGGVNGRPKIGRYSGQGPLGGFVATAARRIALRMATGAARFQGEQALIDQFSQSYEQETLMLKRQHRDVFNRALSVALRQLSGRDRLILRLNLLERVSTTRIAAMYKVSQPTVSRWIQRSAREIFSTVKDLVCDELEIDTRELESLLLLVRSQIEITISHAGDSAVSRA